MTRRLLLLLPLAALLAGCSTTARAPVAPEPACAVPPGEEKDGGTGGTGNAPDPCAALPAQ